MSTECYYGQCPHHSSQHGDEGPFCDEIKCKVDEQQLCQYERERAIWLKTHFPQHYAEKQ